MNLFYFIALSRRWPSSFSSSALSHPQNVTAHSTSPTSITVNWNRVIVTEVINASLCYLVQWTEDGNGVERNATANTTSYVITDLRMATEYNVCVATVHNAVISEFSSKVLVRTQDLQGKLDRCLNPVGVRGKNEITSQTSLKKSALKLRKILRGAAYILQPSTSNWDLRHHLRFFPL